MTVLMTPKASDLGEIAPSSVESLTQTFCWFPGKTAEVSQVIVCPGPGRTPDVSPLIFVSEIQVAPPSREYSRLMV